MNLNMYETRLRMNNDIVYESYERPKIILCPEVTKDWFNIPKNGQWTLTLHKRKQHEDSYRCQIKSYVICVTDPRDEKIYKYPIYLATYCTLVEKYNIEKTFWLGAIVG